MKSKVLNLFVASGLSLSLTHVASASMILVDFGRTDNQTTGNYNNVHGDASVLETPSITLIDSGGASTGITLETDFSLGGSWAGTGADYAGSYPAEVSRQPVSALSDSMFVRDPASVLLTLSNLEAGSMYEILIYGARGNNGGADTEWTVTGGSAPIEVGYDVFENTANVASFTGVVPDGSNEITIAYTTSDDRSRPRGGMNFMEINVTSSIPEPSSSLLSLSAGFAFLIRRKRA